MSRNLRYKLRQIFCLRNMLITSVFVVVIVLEIILIPLILQRTEELKEKHRQENSTQP